VRALLAADNIRMMDHDPGVGDPRLRVRAKARDRVVDARDGRCAGATQDEQIGFSFNLFVGGLDTVTANITNQTLHLARNPQHRKLLRENPALIPNAIDEFMRAYGAVTTFRTCAKETTVRGVTMKPGDSVTVFGWRARTDPHLAASRQVTLSDGRKLASGPPAGTGGQ